MDFSLITYFVPLHDSAFLTKFAQFLTIFAEDVVVVLVGALLYWCIDTEKGQRMSVIAIGGVSWTLGLKNVLKIPRPWDLGILKKEQVIRIETATGYSFPSGHTASAVNVYGYLAQYAKKAVRILLWAFVALIGLSRIFLGCHTSYDVIAALVLSILWLWLGGKAYDGLMAKDERNIFWFAVPMLFGLLTLFGGVDKDIIKMSAFGIVALLGIFFERKYVHFSAAGPVPLRAAEYIVGVLIVAVLKFWPKLIGGDFYEQTWLKATDYALIALWMTLVYPWILRRFQLYIQTRKETKK